MRTLVCILALLAANLAYAAPAPPPRPCTVEAVLGATDAHVLRLTLLGYHLNDILRTDSVRRLSCLQREKDPAKWVAAHLTAEAVSGGKGVRVRLEGCHPREAMTLLSALVDAYAQKRGGQSQEMQTQMMLRRAILVQQQARVGAAGGQLVLSLRRLEQMANESNLPAVLEAPKVIRTR